MSLDRTNHIIAIGASAGGMEEINSFFDHTPLDGVSYIIVQHLSPDFKSRMVELLGRHSKLLVREAENAMPVHCNEVYLIPNDQYMTISGGKLYLAAKKDRKGPHLTIDTFFSSLAADIGPKAIAIVLSGLGADGSEGIRSIKNAGGMVIVREPVGSEFSSMPSNAIATGLADLVIEPSLMPAAIEDHVAGQSGLPKAPEDEDRSLDAIISFVKETSPMDFTDYKKSTILRRTLRRAAQLNFTALDRYLQYLKATPEEVGALSKDFLISVTGFFRDKGAFSFLEANVLPSIIERLAPDEELKIWVAGCATGEEVYTFAILVCELLQGRNADRVVKLFATDIDKAALAHAGKGLYSQDIAREISPGRLEKHFTREGQQYRIKPDIRRMVIFAHHDLAKNPPYCNMHLISCRNLLIYMTPVLQKKIFTMLLFGLKRDGYLFLGASENPEPIIKYLEVVDKRWKVYRNPEAHRGVSFNAFSLPDLPAAKRASSSRLAGNEDNGPGLLVEQAMNAHLSAAFECLHICMTERLRVVKAYGDSSRFLLQKHFTTDLNELLPKVLAVALKTLAGRALKSNGRAEASKIRIGGDGSPTMVSLAVSPLDVSGEERLLSVVFRQDMSEQATVPGTVFDEQAYFGQYTRDLEDENKILKERLKASYERLDATNENMQSFNEELISANEEMQSTNEEMQSVNEELHTINADYQLKNKELLEINDHLNNYFRSNINGQLFINGELELMKFSPGAVKLINLQESDVGRPLSHISTNIKLDTVIDDIKRVFAEGIVITKEIETASGDWYQSMTMPYVRQADNSNDGAVITFYDITALKNAQHELDQKNRMLLRINEDLDHFIHAASHDLLAPLGHIESSIGIITNHALSDGEQREFLEVISSSIKKFRELITDIATIAKVEGDMIKLEKVDLEEIIDNIEWALEDKILASGAVIRRDLEVKELLFSKKNLRSIVFNLISNAIKFRGSESPLIAIRTELRDGHIILSVQDNGKGIPKASIGKVFQMYGRLSQDIEGHGIGLYLAKKIVNAAGGSIVVQSEPDSGTIFSIHLKI
jgi:two-component system CheB/CheR fusion protein